MKRCPKCDFSFVNFHHVCDFDGTDLVDDPETLPVSPAVLALVAATQSPFLRLVKSPDFLIGLALAGLVSSAFLIGYFDAAIQPNSIAEGPASLNSPPNYIASLVPPAQPSDQPPARIRTRAASTRFLRGSRTGSGRQSSASLLTAHCPLPTALHTSPSIRNQQTRQEIALQRQPKDMTLQKEHKESALQRDSKENANRKDSKLTATLKTTWRILKKPFKF